MSVDPLVGHCKWFDASKGYGFLTVMNGPDAGKKDVFVHHSALILGSDVPQYRLLYKGEYVQFAIADGSKGPQATAVTGVYGGPLMCEMTSSPHHQRHTSAQDVVEDPSARGSGIPVARVIMNRGP